MKYYPTSRRKQHVWRAQAFDYALADRASASSPIASILGDPKAQDYPPAQRLFEDAVLGLYKFKPEAKPLEEIAPSSRLNAAIVERLREEPRWDELRAATRLDEAMAILGAAALGEKALDILTDEMRRAVQEASAAEQEAQRQQTLAQVLADRVAQGQGPPDAAQRSQQAQQAAEQAMMCAQEAATRAVQSFEGDSGAQRRLRKALRESVEDAKSHLQDLAGWGSGAGLSVDVSPQERLALAEAIHESQKLREIARLAGRLKNIALAVEAARVPTRVGDIFGVELGKDLTRVLPLEMAKMRHPVLRLDFLRRLGQGQLLQYRLKERDKAALGPLVVAWDESGSMAGIKEIRAKAIALALLAIAQKQQRAWAGVAFSARGQIRSVTFEKPHVQVRPGDLLELARHFYAGGTDFRLALDAAREIIGERPFTRADIIFITDGIAALTAEYLQDLLSWKQRTGARIFTVVVSGGSLASVEQWSDRVESDASIFTDARKFDAAAKQIFGGV